MARLRGVIFGIRNVLLRDDGDGQGSLDQTVFEEMGRLVKFLIANDIQPIMLANHDWTVTDDSGDQQPLKDFLESQWGGDFEWCIGLRNGPAKQTTEALDELRRKLGYSANETLYVGNSETDMQSAVNGKTLFLNALWYADTTEYGFRCSSPKQAGRFIDTFCLREHYWYFKIEDGDLRVYSLAPFSTYLEQYKEYSESLIETVKLKLGDDDDVDFWGKYLCTSTYFSGVYEAVDYICPYPGHRRGSVPRVLEVPMQTFAKCFRKRFVPDLLVRHTDAIESKRNRDSVDHLNQLNTIRLNQKPEKSPGKPYAKCPVRSGKTVLVVDDILSNGLSFEAARAYLRNAGANVVCVSFLKTMKREYRAIADFERFPGSPYDPYTFSPVTITKTFDYRRNIVDPAAPRELSEKLERYTNWDWP